MSQYLYPVYESVNPQSIGIQVVNLTTCNEQKKAYIEVYCFFDKMTNNYKFYVIMQKNDTNELIEKEVFPTQESFTYFLNWLYQYGQYYHFDNYCLEFYDSFYSGNATYYGYQRKFMTAVKSTVKSTFDYIWSDSNNLLTNSVHEPVVEPISESVAEPVIEGSDNLSVPASGVHSESVAEPVIEGSDNLSVPASGVHSESVAQPVIEGSDNLSVPASGVHSESVADPTDLDAEPVMDLCAESESKPDISKFLKKASDDIEIKIGNANKIVRVNTDLLRVLKSCLNGDSEDSELSKFLQYKNTRKIVQALIKEVEKKIKQGKNGEFQSIDFTDSKSRIPTNIGKSKLEIWNNILKFSEDISIQIRLLEYMNSIVFQLFYRTGLISKNIEISKLDWGYSLSEDEKKEFDKMLEIEPSLGTSHVETFTDSWFFGNTDNNLSEKCFKCKLWHERVQQRYCCGFQKKIKKIKD